MIALTETQLVCCFLPAVFDLADALWCVPCSDPEVCLSSGLIFEVTSFSECSLLFFATLGALRPLQ